MLSKPHDRANDDPDMDMIGECKACRAVVKAKRWRCRVGHLDMVFVECPTCKARSRSKAGGSVEMRPEPAGPEKPR